MTQDVFQQGQDLAAAALPDRIFQKRLGEWLERARIAAAASGSEAEFMAMVGSAYRASGGVDVLQIAADRAALPLILSEAEALVAP